MRRYLLVALWPAGLAVITAATVAALRRGPASSPEGSGDLPGSGEAEPGARIDEAQLAAIVGTGTDAKPVVSGASGRPGAFSLLAQKAGLPARPDSALPEWLPGVIQLSAISAAGGVLSYQVMALLGGPIVKYGPLIDEPMFDWTGKHQVRAWAAIMHRLNKIGNTWTIWGGSGAAAACLATAWPKRKWLPPSALGAAILVDHYVTLALRHKFGRPGPPTSPLGTYPSGGCDRVILFYGLIANMLWREFSGSYRGKVLALGAMSALAFNQAYCRQYLSKHWFSDIVTGLIYGVVLYLPFAAAIRLIAGPGRAQPGTVAVTVSPNGVHGVSASVAPVASVRR